jgi:hypothetical protein
MNSDNIYNKFINSIITNGLINTLDKSLKWFRIYLRKKWILYFNKSRKDVFTSIYNKNHWSSAESLSGEGSELIQTTSIRKHLPKLLKKFDCKSILDAPCGDFNWMKKIIINSEFKYIGGDIVEKLVLSNNLKYSSQKISFIKIDICEDNLPESDIMICRDCLFHLSYSDINKFLKNFVASNINYLLVTTHINKGNYFENKDISSGDFRLIDLFKDPFNLPNDINYRFDDYSDPVPPREMILLKRESLVDWFKHNTSLC